MMFEELYIIVKGVKKKVDLSIPSGITLNYKSCIFGDLSKITCSYTYTFKLPLTANNRRLFDNADDIRAKSSMIRRKLKAEYIQNGIPLFSNCNLYIESAENGFNAVMTWGVVDGLQSLKDNDIPLNELSVELENSQYSSDIQDVSDFDNTRDFLKPAYSAGLPFLLHLKFELLGIPVDKYYLTPYLPLPVVPVHRLLKAINNHFGTKFAISNDYDYRHLQSGEWESTHDDVVFNRGVVPLINAELTEEQIDNICVKVGTIGRGSNANYCGKNNIFEFAGSANIPNNFYILEQHGTISNGDRYTTIEVPSYNGGLKFELDGILSLQLDCLTNDKPKFCIYQKLLSKDEAEEVASVEGIYDFGSQSFVFDFRLINGKERLRFNYYKFIDSTLEGGKDCVFFLGVDKKIKSLGNDLALNIYASPDSSQTGYTDWYSRECCQYSLDTVKRLPDISCMEFVKSLFYMSGSVPVTRDDGSVGIMYYSDIKSNLKNRKVLNWSEKVGFNDNFSPDKITYAVNGFGQNNYYLTKTDKIETNNDNGNSDVYDDGKGVIMVNNECLERSKTIVTIPFSAPYSKSKTSPQIDTGDTFKFWERDSDGNVKNCTFNPICGIIDYLDCEFTNGENRSVMTMRCWNEFNGITHNPSYSYLSKILENPIIITETVRLNELDLRSLDYSVPVYIDKYNAYFAIVSITRDSKGVCKCELIKLPEEE